MLSARSPLAKLTPIAAAMLLSTWTTAAAAYDDCPPGSNKKTEDGFTWCEPTVCSTAVPCKADEVCRPIALCMEVGTLADAGTRDAGQRLVVTQRCVAGQQPGDPKTCPQKQTCSDLNRCISKPVAEKLGLLDVPATAASGASSSGATDAKKSSCGCDVVGTHRSGAGALALGLCLSLAFAQRRRRSAPRS